VAAALVLALASGRPAPAAVGPVLVVGDSLEVGTGPYLRSELLSTPITIDAEVGRPSSEGLRILRERLQPEHKVVVFDLGTNDNPSQVAALGRTLAAARELVGGRCLVVSTLQRPPVHGVTEDGMNQLIADFASANANVRLVEWEAATSANPRILRPDGVHATAAGYAERARLVASAIEECVTPPKRPAKPRRDSDESPQDKPARPRPRPVVRAGTSWIDLVTGLSLYQSLARYVNGAVAMTRSAGGSTNAAVSPLPPEIRLGEAPSSGRRSARAR
jgi:hypothetical protein